MNEEFLIFDLVIFDCVLLHKILNRAIKNQKRPNLQSLKLEKCLGFSKVF